MQTQLLYVFSSNQLVIFEHFSKIPGTSLGYVTFKPSFHYPDFHTFVNSQSISHITLHIAEFFSLWAQNKEYQAGWMFMLYELLKTLSIISNSLVTKNTKFLSTSPAPNYIWIWMKLSYSHPDPLPFSLQMLNHDESKRKTTLSASIIGLNQ